LAPCSRDRCLKDFESYPVTLHLKSGEVHHGCLDVERTGLEFVYEKPASDEDITKASYLIYQPEYNTVHALVRYHDALDEKQMRTRERAERKAYHPGLIRRSCRALRNFFASVKDAIVEALGLVVGRMKGIQAVAPIMKSGGAYLDRVGKQAIGTAADVTYDPLLEKQIGMRVVLQLPDDSPGPNEYVGTLREYTKDFFELLGVDYERVWEVAVMGEESGASAGAIAMERTPNGVRLENRNPFDVELEAVTIQGEGEGADGSAVPVEMPMQVAAGATVQFAIPSDAKSISLKFRTRRKADLIVPRTGSFIRHKSE